MTLAQPAATRARHRLQVGGRRREGGLAERETRARLLGAAADRFATRGFRNVTVREICRAARANVAAVNYHFGGKLGLYRQVVNEAVDVMQATTDAAIRAGAGKPPGEQLRAYISVFVARVGEAGPGSWIHRLMLREVADPTPALDLIAARVLAPRLTYLRETVAQLLGRGPADDVVSWCVLSIHSQCLAVLPHSMTVYSQWLPHASGNGALESLAEHIAEFSIGGIERVQGVQKVQEVQEVREVREVRTL